MLNIKGRLNKKGEIVLQEGQSFSQDSIIDGMSNQHSSGNNFKSSATIDVSSLISGINGFVWATKDIQQAEIIANALKVQNIELEIVNVELEKCVLYLIRVLHEEDVKEVIDFIQTDKGGLRLKPDWIYPEGEQNESFEKWIKG